MRNVGRFLDVQIYYHKIGFKIFFTAFSNENDFNQKNNRFAKKLKSLQQNNFRRGVGEKRFI